MLFGKKLRKVLALLLLSSFLATTAIADPNAGKFSRVEKGSPSPFDAWCFDDTATAKIQARIEFNEERCKLLVGESLAKQKQQHMLEIGNLNLRIDTILKENRNILAIKDREIERLESAAIKRPGDYSHWWATGGFAAGVVSTIVIFFVIK